MTREDIIQECRAVTKGREIDVKAFLDKFQEYHEKGYLDHAIRTYTEELFKLTYKHWRFSEILDALEHIAEDATQDFLERALQDSLERGFLRGDIRHNSTNEMDNITRRWKAEVEPEIYSGLKNWTHRISANA